MSNSATPKDPSKLSGPATSEAATSTPAASTLTTSGKWPLPGRMIYGGDYSPEQWPREVWDEDIALMQQAGVNMVSIGMFAWALMEPEEGRFDFEWLDDILDRLHAGGIDVDLGTPTTSPPAWFFKKYPHARAVTKDGVPLGFGSRGIVAPTSPDYRRAAVRITTALATRYGNHPAVKMWHVHNEYGVPISDEYSVHAEMAFREWLKARYGTLEKLNDAWGTRFWGQYYYEWDQIDPPRRTPAVINPGQRLDFARFSDDALLECFILERDAIRAWAPQPITTNFMANQSWQTDLWKWAKEVDIVSDDHYLWAADPEGHIGLAIAADLTRSLAGGKPWILMEHSTSAVNWQDRNVAKRPNEMMQNSLTHVGRGSDAVMFFQWRASRAGTEKFHSAMVPHSGTKSRIWKEVVELGALLDQLDQVQGSVVEAEVAFLLDFEDHWVLTGEGHPSIDVTFPTQVRRYYEPFWHDNIAVDFVHPGQDLSKYRLVVAPLSYMMSQEEADNLNRYVEGGGNLLVSFYSGIVDRNERIHPSPTDDGGFMSLLKPSLGVVVEEFLPFREGESGTVTFTEPLAGSTLAEGAPDGAHWDAESTVWQEDLRLEGATPVAFYTEGPAALLQGNAPAVTRHSNASGGVGYYISTQLEPSALANVLRQAYQNAGVKAPWANTELRVMTRSQPEDSADKEGSRTQFLFALNGSNNPVKLEASGWDLRHNEPRVWGELVAPGQVVVLRTTATETDPNQ